LAGRGNLPGHCLADADSALSIESIPALSISNLQRLSRSVA